MLYNSGVSSQSIPETDCRRYDGKRMAKRHALTPRQRAEIAANLVDNKCGWENWTVEQAAAVGAKVSSVPGGHTELNKPFIVQGDVGAVVRLPRGAWEPALNGCEQSIPLLG
jgi:hypothetical protein